MKTTIDLLLRKKYLWAINKMLTINLDGYNLHPVKKSEHSSAGILF